MLHIGTSFTLVGAWAKVWDPKNVNLYW